MPSLSLRATLDVTSTSSKLSFSLTANAISPSATLLISLALASVVTILPLFKRLVTWPLIKAFLWLEVIFDTVGLRNWACVIALACDSDLCCAYLGVV